MSAEFQFQHPAGVHVSRHLKEPQLVAAVPQVSASKRDIHTGWVWYQLPSFSDADVLVLMSLGFNRGALEQIELTDADPRYGTSWNDWSEEKQHRRAASIGRWLGERGYSPGSYPWGRVWCGYDAKGGSGFAAVQFTTEAGRSVA